ncbi:MAG: hypothetical protein HN929_12740 [Chloroflexi bacterium]|jgi:hypothetical protein|nr:hypothetical protein [Chloroflexota bacterium]
MKNWQVLVALSVLGLTGCGGSDESESNSPPDNIPEVATETIGSSGGSITTPASKVTITIPPGALSSDQDITVTLLDSGAIADPLSTTGEMLDSGSVGIELSPSGLTFTTPITIAFDLPGASTAVAEGGYEGFSVGLGLGMLVSDNGDVVPLIEPEMSVDPVTGIVSLKSKILHFSDLLWTPLKSGSNQPVRLDVFGYQDTLAVNENIAIVANARYEPGIYDQIHLSWTDLSAAPFNLISGLDTFPLLHDAPHVGAYTCAEVGTGAFKVDIGVEVVSTLTMDDPFNNGTEVQALLINGKERPAYLLVKSIPYNKPVDCIERVSDGGNNGSQTEDFPQSPLIDLVEGIISETVVEVGQTFKVTTRTEMTSLIANNLDLTSWLFVRSVTPGAPVVSGVSVTAVMGGGAQEGDIGPPGTFLKGPGTGESGADEFSWQEWVFKCESEGTYDLVFESEIALQGSMLELLLEETQVLDLGSIECVNPLPPAVSFAAAEFVVDEGVGTAIFTVNSDIPVPEALTVAFRVNSGGTVDVFDYEVLGQGTVDFAVGASSATIEVLIEDDPDVEPDETLILELLPIDAIPGAVAYGLAAPTQSTLTIKNNDTANSSGGQIDWVQTPIEQLIGDSQTYQLQGTVPETSVGAVTHWNTVAPTFLFMGTYTISDILFGGKPAAENSPRKLAAKSTSTITIDNSPAGPIAINAVLECIAEGSDIMTATVTDVNDVVLMSTDVTVSCVRPPASTACLSAASGLEMAYECNNDLVGNLAIEDIFEPDVIDVPIGGIDRTLPGGVTLYLPSVINGEIAKETDFSVHGWDASISPPADPEPAMFGLDANHQYLFIQYESGVDLIDLSTPDAAPVYSGLLDYSGRLQEAEFQNSGDFSKVHDYMVMPLHTASGDYLIGCGTDVVRHDFDPDANAGAGAFEPTGVRISDGFEICRDVWSDSNLDNVSPGYAYTTKTISKSQKTTRWLEEGQADVFLEGDWVTSNVDDNNRIMGGAGGFFGENTLLGSRGIDVLGLWSGMPGIAAEDSVTRISDAAFFQDIRCTEALCVATSSDTITTLSWPDRNIAPSVIESSAMFSTNLKATNMLVASSGSIFLPAVSGTQVIIGRVNSAGEFGGTIKVNVSSVCTDPKGAYILDMNHLGIMCRNDNQFKVMEFLPVL